MANITCPSCKTGGACTLPAKGGRQPTACKKCGVGLTCNQVRIRAKRSRGLSGITSHRSFDVRVIEADGTEQLIQFVNAAYHDFELRAKDQVVLVYRDGRLCLIYNLTIGMEYLVVTPNEGKAWLIAIAAVTIVLLLWAMSAIYR